MPQINIGDTVRFLNSTGGGIVTRLKDNIAYVADDDGFETPVLIKECVPVAVPKSTAAEKTQVSAPAAVSATVQLSDMPYVPETAGGEKLNIVIGFEASDLKRLSTASFDAYLINDSNFWLHYTVATRGRHGDEWTLRASATLEPSTQDFLFEIAAADLPEIDRISFQAIAFKRGKDFTLKSPVIYEHRLDATKFARLHCFQPNPYFDVPVIALEVAKDDAVAPHAMPIPTSDEITRAMAAKAQPAKPRPSSHRQDPAKEILEVDLHATQLLDTTAGMSSSEILNYQIDYFRRVMDENLRFPGRKIVFIHGNGEGVLRQALMKELTHRYKGHDISDASFREYGFGATMVTIRRQKR